MKRKIHVYALFDARGPAIAAYREVQARGCGDEHCSVLVHEGILDEEELPIDETAVREGAIKGAVATGATGAAVLGGLAALGGGFLGIGPLAAALFGAGSGAAFGGLLGAISGASDPDKALRRIEDEVRNGKILVAVETDDPSLQATCRTVFTEHGGSLVLGG